MLKQYVDRQDDENFSRDIVEVSVIDVEARRMLETGIIEPSTSPIYIANCYSQEEGRLQ